MLSKSNETSSLITRMLSSSGKVTFSTGVAAGARRSKTEEVAVVEVLGEYAPSLSKTVGQGVPCPCLNLHCLQARGLLAGTVSVWVEAVTVACDEPACVRLERCSQEAVCVLASLILEIVCVPALFERIGSGTYRVLEVRGDSNSAAWC